MNTNPCVPLSLTLLVASFAWTANAQDEDMMGFGEDEPSAVEETPKEEGLSEEDAFLAGEQTEEEKLLAAPEEDKTAGRAEDPKTGYFGVGPRLRWIMIPRWFIGMFGVDIKSRENNHLLINNVGAGAEFTYRKDGFDITAAIWYIGLNWDGYVSFKDKDEEANGYEVVTNNLRGLMITVDFLWSTDIVDWLAITYGAGIGLGIPFDNNFVRTEASASSDHLDPCTSHPDPANDCYDNEEYGEIYELPTKVIPWINFLFGLRFKPHRHFAIYVDAGFGIGFQAGLRGAYIF